MKLGSILSISFAIGLGVILTSCKDEYANRTIWSSETMTLEEETVNIKNLMLYDEYFDSRYGETICSLHKIPGSTWTFFVRKGDSLYKSKNCPLKYLSIQDAYGNITHPKNELWQKRILSIANEPSYTVEQSGQRLKLVYNDGTTYVFTKD